MLKNILNLKGAQQLSKNEQSTLKGGRGQSEKCPSLCTGPVGSPCQGTGQCNFFLCQEDNLYYFKCVGGIGGQ